MNETAMTIPCTMKDHLKIRYSVLLLITSELMSEKEKNIWSIRLCQPGLNMSSQGTVKFSQPPFEG